LLYIVDIKESITKQFDSLAVLAVRQKKTSLNAPGKIDELA